MNYNLVYMAKPIYGGWVTFTSHLCLKYNCKLFKIAKRTEIKTRQFGYDVQYTNLRIDELIKLPNLVITSLDKHYWKYLYLFPKNTILIIHDPTELKGKENPIINLLKHFRIITIRKTVQKLLKDTYNIESEFKYHPFYEYTKIKENHNYYSLSISRIDFDKNTDILLKANQLINDDDKGIQIFGAENRLYVHHKLKDLDFNKYWKGKFPKTLPIQYENKDLLNNCKFIVDMSIIKQDGGGTQYTFLEAIYHNCALILHHEWVSKGDTFIKDQNCYVVGNHETMKPEEEIAEILNQGIDSKYKKIVKNSQKLLDNHTNIQWF